MIRLGRNGQSSARCLPTARSPPGGFHINLPRFPVRLLVSAPQAAAGGGHFRSGGFPSRFHPRAPCFHSSSGSAQNVEQHMFNPRALAPSYALQQFEVRPVKPDGYINAQLRRHLIPPEIKNPGRLPGLLYTKIPYHGSQNGGGENVLRFSAQFCGLISVFSRWIAVETACSLTFIAPSSPDISAHSMAALTSEQPSLCTRRYRYLWN